MTHHPVNTHVVTRRDWLLLLLILAVAAFLRLNNGMVDTHFRYDQGQKLRMAQEMLDGQTFHWLGITSSAGVPNSPLTIYILLIPLSLSDNPVVINGMVAVWNLVGVGLLWWMAHRYLGWQVALIAGLLYAINPHAVFYSRFLWAQNYHTTLILAGLAAGLYGFLEGKRWAQIVSLPVFVMGLQMHFAALTLLPLWLILLWMGRKQARPWTVVLSLVLAGLVTLPFAIGLSQSGGATDRATMIGEILRAGVRLRDEPLQFIAHLTTGTGMESHVFNQTDALLREVPHPDALWSVSLALLLAGLIIVWLPRWRRFALFLTTWMLITVLVMIPAWTGSGVYIHYFIPTIPVLMLLIAIAIVEIMTRLNQWLPGKQAGNLLMGSLLAAILLTQVVWTIDFQQFMLTRYTHNPVAFQTATPLAYLMNVREELQNYDDVVIIGGNPHDSNYYIWEPLLHNTAGCVRDVLVDGSFMVILPDDEFAAVIPPHHEAFNVPELYQTDDPTVIPLREGEQPYTIHHFDEAPAWDGPPLTSVDAPVFESGVRLSGYHLSETVMTLRWQVDFIPPVDMEAGFLQYYGHFLDESGERIGQRDTAFPVQAYWCQDDTLITWVDATVPPQTATLRVGMYRLRDNSTRDLMLLDDSGQPAGQWVDIPLE